MITKRKLSTLVSYIENVSKTGLGIQGTTMSIITTRRKMLEFAKPISEYLSEIGVRHTFDIGSQTKFIRIVINRGDWDNQIVLSYYYAGDREGTITGDGINRLKSVIDIKLTMPVYDYTIETLTSLFFSPVKGAENLIANWIGDEND